MTRAFAVAVVAVGFVAAAWEPASATQATNVPPATIALVTTLADGRVKHELVSARPASSWVPVSWVPALPRVESPTLPNGPLPVTALQIARQLAGQDVRVVVSVLRGSPHQQEDIVATVTVSRGAHVIVNELTAYGIAPVDLSLIDVAPTTPFLPSGVSITPDVEISRIDVLAAPYPGYRVTLRNLSSKAVATFHVRAHGPDQSSSTVRAGLHGQPAMRAGESYSFDVNLTSGGRGEGSAWSPTPLDVIEIDAVLWGDGTVSGEFSGGASWMITTDAGRRVQLVRAVDVLRAALAEAGWADEMLAKVRTGFEALPLDDETLLPAARQTMVEARGTILNDLREFESDPSRSHDADAVRRWIQLTLERYGRWIKQLSPL